MRQKPATWTKYARMAAAAREVVCLYAIGWIPWPTVMGTFPKDVRKELETFRPEQSDRLSESPDVNDKAHKRRWLKQLAMQFVERDPKESHISTPSPEKPRDYARCFAISRAVFSEAALEGARRRFESFPSPEALRKFLIEWGEKHRPSKPSDKDRSRRSLSLTDQARRLLLTARVGTAVPNGPFKQLTKLHVHIAHTLASWPHAYGQPSHQHLAFATGTSIRTVRRVVPALRALRLLPQSDPLETKTMPKTMPRHVHGFRRVMALIAKHADDVPVKTLYRWERDYKALQKRAAAAQEVVLADAVLT
jgi:hypothetical protein